MGRPKASSVVACVSGLVMLAWPAAGTEVERYVFGIAPPSIDGVNPGADAEIAAVIAQQADIRISVQVVDEQTLLSALAVGDIDIAITGGTGRQEGIIFTQTAVLNTGVLVVSAAAEFGGFEDLGGARIAVVAGSRWEAQLEATDLDVTPLESTDALVSAVKAGIADAAYVNRAVYLFQSRVLGQFCGTRLLHDYIDTDFAQSRFAVREEDSSLAARLNRAINDLRAVGILFGGTYHYHPNDVHPAVSCRNVE